MELRVPTCGIKTASEHINFHLLFAVDGRDRMNCTGKDTVYGHRKGWKIRDTLAYIPRYSIRYSTLANNAHTSYLNSQARDVHSCSRTM